MTIYPNIKREDFIPGIYKSHASKKEAVPIGEFQVTENPDELLRLISELRLAPEDTVLEIGTGSGFATALIFASAHPKQVITIERIRKLCGLASHNLKQYFPQELHDKKIIILHEDATHIEHILRENPTLPQKFSKIFVSVELPKNFLEKLIEILETEGLLVFPEDGMINIYTKSKREKPFYLESIKNMKRELFRHGKA